MQENSSGGKGGLRWDVFLTENLPAKNLFSRNGLTRMRPPKRFMSLINALI